MHRNRLSMTKYNMVSRTSQAKLRVQETIRLAEELKDDTRKSERKEAQQCKACFYYSSIGGAAMTTQNCMSCDSPEMYGSTNTDALCMGCATEFDLCKHCGGDNEMRIRRKEWPEPKI